MMLVGCCVARIGVRCRVCDVELFSSNFVSLAVDSTQTGGVALDQATEPRECWVPSLL
jgi:hypothetical protein